MKPIYSLSTTLILTFFLTAAKGQDQMIFQNINEYGKIIGISGASGNPMLSNLHYVGTAVWEVESLGDYKLIKHVDKGRYMAAIGTKLAFANNKYDQAARWTIENAEDGLVRLKNEKTGQYLLGSDGQLSFANLDGKELETLWQPLRNIDEIKKDIERKNRRYTGGDEIRFRNRMGTNFIVTDQGSIKLAGGISYGLESSIWIKIPSGDSYYLKNKKNNMYLALNSAGLRMDEAKTENAIWALEDYEGFWHIKHVKLGSYLLFDKETDGLIAGPIPTGSYLVTMYAEWKLYE